ncbi:hypothetical protein AXF42_Ash006320 [Apostasia shenzhenica]|uniref:Sec39 domain-containing protein n=1 Tax=Apostasia shenzhenica TaxID=1088818 RepID=A0A2I0AYT4_9ASPA|nr:hypothetical protein AXF42_Ash006320 [Apostasia shenzhenica]
MMEREKGEAAHEVFYEIRRHAAGVFSPDVSHYQRGGGLLSYLSARGAKQLQQKWREYWKPRVCKKNMVLFVSPDGEHIAVAVGNQVVMLQKGDNYMEPCGIYISNDRISLFTNGAWMEPQGILGLIDDMSTLYLINSNGKEIAKQTKSQLKLTFPVIDLIVLDGANSKKPFTSGFGIFTADGLFHCVEITEEPIACFCSIPTSGNYLKERLSWEISCLDFHLNLSLVVLVGAYNASENHKVSTGLYSLYLLRMTRSSDLELVLSSSPFTGLFYSTKGSITSSTCPKVSISPNGKYIATLDLTGCVDIFTFNADEGSLSVLCFTERMHLDIPNIVAHGGKNSLKDVLDISWWTDCVLVLAKRNGFVSMYDVSRDIVVVEDGQHFCMPVMERVKHCSEHVFLLEGTTYGEEPSETGKSSDGKKNSNDNQTDIHWNLLSIGGKSISEMYGVLISKQQYHTALEFANQRGLDRDEVFKAQWLSSDYATQDIDMFLSKISDRRFVLSECINKIGPTEDAAKALLSYGMHVTKDYVFSGSCNEESSLIWDFRVARLQLLQYRDKLDTFVGINMGRFVVEEYDNFRIAPVTQAALNLAESGKIGALNLLFKRHPYSLASEMLNILSSIPETVPVQSYGQLLPGRSPPAILALRERDWVECEHMLSFIAKMPVGCETFTKPRTEHIVKLSLGFVWPSVTELVAWYQNRAKDIDALSGQLENCQALLEFACRKGIVELQDFLDDVACLNQLIYADGYSEDFTMGFVRWEKLSDYEKFKMLLKEVTEDSVVEILREKARPFMMKHYQSEKLDFIELMYGQNSSIPLKSCGSFLVRWMKEIAADNKLEICLKVIERFGGESPISGIFSNEIEMIETALQCIYSCMAADKWNVMASILSKLLRNSMREKTLKVVNPKHASQGPTTPKFSYIRNHLAKSMRQSSPSNLHEEDSPQLNFDGADQLDFCLNDDNLEKRIKIAEGHVEVGRLFAYYQVPKPISFFLSSQSDEKNVKQILRLILSKFGRRQPGRSDSEWANMWNDMHCFQEKAFPFLDTEYMLVEFCRGLLKAGKFSLARNYLKGTSTVTLATEKAESLVVQAAREYFFSASSLSCSEIWKARECLSLFPNSKAVQSEADVIQALTVRLPNLGVSLLPVQFKQIRNPMEIISMVISSQTGAYLNVEELIEVAKLLGLSSQDDIAAVEEAIAREAAVTGDLQLASDLCLVLAKKGHGAIWDLCAAIARGPHLDDMDTGSRKQLLGFALCHCDEESIGELLHAWKEVDMHMHYEQLMLSTETCPPNFSFQGSSIVSLPVNSLHDILKLRDNSESISSFSYKNEKYVQSDFDSIKSLLLEVAEECLNEDETSWDSLLRENRKFLKFAALELPWLLEISSNEEYGRKVIPAANASPEKHSVSIRFRALVVILQWLAANDIVPKDELIISLVKSVMATPVTKEDDVLGCSFLLNLLDAFHGVDVIEEQLKQRTSYQEIYSIMSIGMSYSSIQNSHKKCCNPKQRRELLLRKSREKHASFSSDEVEQIDKMQSTFWREWKEKLEEQRRLADQARSLEETIPGVVADRFLSGDTEYIRSVVFSMIESVKTQKRRVLKEAMKLANTYGLQHTEVLLRFFGCALVSEQWGNDDILTEISEYREDIVKCAKDVIEMISVVVFPEINGRDKQRLSYIFSILSACHLRLKITELSNRKQDHKLVVEPFQFYKVLEQECQRVAFIKDLDFKCIAIFDQLNYENFNEEILNNVHESSVEALAEMACNLVSMCSDTHKMGLVSLEDVYKHHVLSFMATLENQKAERPSSNNIEQFQGLFREVDLQYDICTKYIMALPNVDISYIIKRYQILCIPCISSWNLLDDVGWKDCLIMVLKFWIKLAVNVQEKSDFVNAESLPRLLNAFKKLVMEDQISPTAGWRTIDNCVCAGDEGGLFGSSSFLKFMIISGCKFHAIAEVYLKAYSEGSLKNLLDLYVSLAETLISHDRRNLHRLLSSLSMMEGGYTEDLKVVRYEIWRKLSAFSNDKHLESNIKVYALELMQSITGQNCISLPDELVSEIEPWEAWGESCHSRSLTTAYETDGSSKLTSALIALRSAHLIAAFMPDITISAEDLMTPASSVTCFLNLCEAATSPADLEVLQAILEDWEVLFSCKTDNAEAEDYPEDQSKWNDDGWNEGWETLPDDLINAELKEDQSPSIRPLHACWMEIMKRLISHSRLDKVVKLLDQSLTKCSGLLLDENEAQLLFHMVVNLDCLTALKLLLLLPYAGLQLQALQAVESKLKKTGAPSTSDAEESELLMIILSSGTIQTIILDPSLGNFFSYICYLVGQLARTHQEDLLKCKEDENGGPNPTTSLLFGRILLPYFIAELVLAKQYILAGFIVSQWMHTPPSFGLIDIVEASLRKYIEGQLLQAGDSGHEDLLNERSSLPSTLSKLRVKLSNLLQSSLLALPQNTRDEAELNHRSAIAALATAGRSYPAPASLGSQRRLQHHSALLDLQAARCSSAPTTPAHPST